MIKIFFFFLLFSSLLFTQGLSHSFTERAGINSNIFFNPTELSKINYISSSINLNNKSFFFLKELNSLENNQEISQLLNRNIGKEIDFSLKNFLSLKYSTNNIIYSLGFASALDGYFISHSGFGSKRALESYITHYQTLIGTMVIQKKALKYGLNLKLMKKNQTIYNYSINQLNQKSMFDYFDNEFTKKAYSLGLDIGINYQFSNNYLKPSLSLAFLNIGDTSFKALGSIKNSSNIKFSLQPKEMHIQMEYKDHQFRIDMSKKFLNNQLEIHSGINNQALSIGMSYQYNKIHLGIHSYKVTRFNHRKERNNELLMAIKW